MFTNMFSLNNLYTQHIMNNVAAAAAATPQQQQQLQGQEEIDQLFPHQELNQQPHHQGSSFVNFTAFPITFKIVCISCFSSPKAK